jgi:hypothetical protein
LEEIEYGADRDSHQPKREKEEPHHGVKDQGQQGHGPAEYEEDAPEQERRHPLAPILFDGLLSVRSIPRISPKFMTRHGKP